jgi:two-component system, LuxR family, sensor kinase FixL
MNECRRSDLRLDTSRPPAPCGDPCFRSLVEAIVDGVITIDDRGTIGSVNPAACRIFGYDAGELVGRNVAMLMPPGDARDHDAHVSRYLAGGPSRIIGVGREVAGRRKDGTTFPLDLAVTEVRMGEGRMFTGILRDLTERRRLERQIVDASEEQQRQIGRELHGGCASNWPGSRSRRRC